MLVVSEVESRGGDTRVHARVNLVTVTNTSLNEGSIRLLAGDGTILVTSNSTTSFEDDTGADTSPPFRLNEINSGDFLEINAYSDGSGIVASEVHRRAADDVIVQGKVEQNSGSTITLLGVSFFTDGGTQYEDGNDAPLAGGAATFFGIDRAGDLVKIKDNQPGDGTADEVDLED